ncbi:NAD(P)H-dependent flavin oxidoreductase [Bacteroides coprosuis]|uniref:NAD(P)H-dependent flavin oxidoreductase n=1 Tax=Bacteroides coprosuis TaxID=151276 RepID=UPI001DC7C163|nr:nitronate monooxygenase [Bacteroides coprosuis]HJD91649.1 nitronate monooxygenase [Bacteroides coprosuis]
MKHLNLQIPIIQAPMAGGITTPQLVSKISNLGALGSYAAGYIKTPQMEEDIKEIQSLTHKPFMVNLFVPEKYIVDPDAVQIAIKALDPIYKKFELTPQLPSNNPEKDLKRFNQQIDKLIELRVPICSFVFGIPSKEVIQRLKDNDILTMATATSVEEALAIEKAGIDIVIAQGIEAGGHRGGFLEPMQQIPLTTLLPQVVKAVAIPVIAAGGIMTKPDIQKARELGAIAVQMGTAFLLTDESGATEAYKESIIQEKQDNTVLTKAFSGKYARGIRNEFITLIESQPENAILPYPIQNSLTKSIRKSARKNQNPQFISLWCGQNGYSGKRQSVKDLLDSLI